ncbi:hypothetical protein [Corynebacterium pseudopelargi]|uniref:Uncharacterized protein n=1 Tax=Corynebacterium pseudopelargi TaxID=2080757 RepID=A0A3G6IV27_9CORY|nr:hypothetical protein [Corynebacterium pseudopelargi]AZA08478.1 hypothetical protein CPPEL_01655 [Corynebacterium pseudopelargi]
MDSQNFAPDRLPEKYYKRRRAAAAIVLVILALLFVWLVSSLRGNDDSEQVAQSSSVTATSTTTTTTSSAQEEESTESAESSQESTEAASSEAPAEDATCRVEDLQVIAKTNRPDYPAGEQPVFYMTVRNPTEVDCEVDLDEQPLRFEVYDLGTNQRVWSDIDCNNPVAQGRQTFKAGQERSFEAAWSRTQSAPNECGDRPEAAPGGYYLHTVIGQNPSQPVTFNLA